MLNPYRPYPEPRPQPDPYHDPRQNVYSKPYRETRPQQPNTRLHGEEVEQWSPRVAYVGGDRVLYRGKTYQAKWWTQGDRPDKSVSNPWETPWKLILGAPTEPSNGVKPPTPVSPDREYNTWRPTDIYVAGDRVMYNGKLYEAKWWTKNFEPNKKVSKSWETPWKEIVG